MGMGRCNWKRVPSSVGYRSGNCCLLMTEIGIFFLPISAERAGNHMESGGNMELGGTDGHHLQD